MLNLKDQRVYLACGGTDMRKNNNGLMAIVETDLFLALLKSLHFEKTQHKVTYRTRGYKVSFPYKHYLGYEKEPDGTLCSS